MSEAELARYLARRRREVEAALSAALPRGRSPLRRAMRTAVLGGGKRIRPLLALAAAEAVGGATARRRAMPAACALEMIHAYSLAHDDLPAMDDDDLRRGRPALHVRYGEATAILAGDALLAEAFALLGRSALARPGDRCALALLTEVAEAAGASGLVGGQAADLESEGRPAVGPAAVAAIHRRKTGALIRVSVRAGALAAGASARQLDLLTAYGVALGLAFQITDDILDEVGSADELGRPAGRDQGRGKATFPAALGLEGARRSARRAGRRAARALEPLGARGAVLRALVGRVVSRAA